MLRSKDNGDNSEDNGEDNGEELITTMVVTMVVTIGRTQLHPITTQLHELQPGYTWSWR